MKYYGVPEPAEQLIPNLENLFKSLFFPAMIGISFIVAETSATFFDQRIYQSDHRDYLLLGKWGVITILAIINSVFLVGMGVLAHDAVHKVLFR